ncbi:Cyclin-dependent kinase 9, partial [Acropora cervicornis]
ARGFVGFFLFFFFFSCAFCHPGNQLPVTFIFTGVRRTTWSRARLSFLCQNIIITSHHCVIGMSKDLLDYPFCHDVNKYEKMVKIGQGTFGEVFKARNRKNLKEIVALKKVLMDNEKEGFPITALREIKILQLLKHENVVNLMEICRTKASPYNRNKGSIYLVFEFCEHDLAGLLSNHQIKFQVSEMKKLIQMLLNALYFIHSNKILHRDMKAANVLITKNGVLKLADFGLARAVHVNKEQLQRYTNRVVTLWYRPPELLLGERNYGPPIDLWGAGCIMAELWTRTPIMQGNSEQHQLTLISHLCGSITSEVWPAVEKLDLFNKMVLPTNQKRRVKERLRSYVNDNLALDLIDQMLTIDPSHRIDADTALNHDFFWSDPLPSDLTRTLSSVNKSMFEFLAPPHGRRGQVQATTAAAAQARSSTASQSSVVQSGTFDRVF